MGYLFEHVDRMKKYLLNASEDQAAPMTLYESRRN